MVVYDKFNYHALAPTVMCLQLVDQSVCYPAGIAKNIPVKIRNFFIIVDFVILDMEVDAKTPLILGRLFLSTAKAHIYVGAGEIQLNINGQTERFAFRPNVEQCSQVKTFNRKKFEKEQEKTSTPTIDALVELVERLQLDRKISVHNYRNARRRIKRKEFEEAEAKSIKMKPATKKEWWKKVSSSGTPSGDDNKTKGMESPAPDSKPEPSP
jgi:hypothetical protein